jgi:TROVE domain
LALIARETEMKIGIDKRTREYKKRFKADTVNVAGGTAYTIDSPSQKLLHIVGAPGFNEPRSYYSIPENPDLARKFKGNLHGFTGQAKLILEAATDVARSKTPRDLLAIAHWLRVEGHCRQTPLILLAIAAKEGATRADVRKYAPKIIRRADELAGAYAAYRYIFGKPIPSALLKGIRDAFGNFDEYQLIKYNQPGNTPSMKDVLLQMPDRKPGRPVSRGMAEFLINGSVVDKNGVDHGESAPLVANYLRFLDAAKGGEFNQEMLEMADEARVTWEVLVSLFGNKREVWENVLPRMGYMAILRNARNLSQAGVDTAKISERLTDRKAILRSKQYPFRFLSASKEMAVAPGLTPNVRSAILDAISLALDTSVENVGRITGSTLVLVDVSGSMTWAKPSAKSKLNLKEVAGCISGVLAKACDDAFVYSWASTFELLNIRKNDSVSNIIDKVMRANVGGGTLAYKPLVDATRNGLYADRIVLLSDMQCYHPGAGNFQAALNDYKSKVNRNVWLHSINLNASDGTAQAASGQEHVNLVSGFSDKILATLVEAESGKGEIPTLGYIRKNY